MTAESRYMARKACEACPFRTDKPFYVRPGRAEEFAAQVDMGTFNCHKTVDWNDDGEQVVKPNTQACVGGRIMLLPGQSRLEWFASRAGILIHEPHPYQPVYSSIEAYLEAVERMSP